MHQDPDKQQQDSAWHKKGPPKKQKLPHRTTRDHFEGPAFKQRLPLKQNRESERANFPNFYKAREQYLTARDLCESGPKAGPREAPESQCLCQQ